MKAASCGQALRKACSSAYRARRCNMMKRSTLTV
jgi:hypothetical protein